MNGEILSGNTSKENPIKKVLPMIMVFLLGVVLSSGCWYFMISQKTGKGGFAWLTDNLSKQDESKRTPKEILPIGQSLLTNPAVHSWRGSVEGKLISKDDHTFTLEDSKGNRITITDIMPTGGYYNTVFNKPGDNGKVEQVLLKDIPLQTKLRGDIWVFRGAENTPIGGLFSLGP